MLSRKQKLRNRRKARIKSKITSTADKPRLCVFRSNKYIYSQIIDDTKGETIASSCDCKVKKADHKKYTGKTAKAYEAGMEIGKKALEKNIKRVIFDRNGYKYHGRLKALAEGAREAGLQF